MNREILFKAKRKDNGKWVEGYYYKTLEHVYILQGETANLLRMYKVDPETLCQYTGLNDCTKWESLAENERELFLSEWNYKENRKNEPEDWKGRKIWENDILRGHGNDEDLAKVVFGRFNVIDVETIECLDSVIGWCTEVIETDALSKCEPFCLPMPLTDFYIKRCEYEVVGNVFDGGFDDSKETKEN